MGGKDFELYFLNVQLIPKQVLITKPNLTWAQLIQEIYEVDPLTCPKCQGRMKIISFIEDEEVIEKVLKHILIGIAPVSY